VIEITAVRLSGGDAHEHISHVLWRSNATVLALASVPRLIQWLNDSPTNQARIAHADLELWVSVVAGANGDPHIRARVGESWTDDLLALPRF
jgi:Protein of unknown function (DUF3892)